MTALVSYDADHEDDPSHNANGTRMSRNQLAEQWYAYRLWRLGYHDHPHTLNRNTPDAAMRRHWRM